ncbi:dihydroorotate dehydrogenase electron transfer subunit, partial [Chloroflexota bacterium]
FGPLGNGFTLPTTPQEILLVAGGIGIAPLVFLAKEANQQGNKVTLLLATSSKTSLLPDDILPLQTNIFITEDGSYGHKGLATDWLESPHSFTQKPIFACGPLPMYKTMAQIPGLKDKPVQISLETRMACGLGVCYGCTVKTKNGLKQVCKDGPVFDLDDILWEEPGGV